MALTKKFIITSIIAANNYSGPEQLKWLEKYLKKQSLNKLGDIYYQTVFLRSPRGRWLQENIKK